MAETKLQNHKVAIISTDGFEESELFTPLQALKEAGAEVKILSLKKGSIKAWNQDHWGKDLTVDQAISESQPEDFDALVLPGGVMNPDRLRMDAKTVEFVKAIADAGKPIAAICHGPWTLVEADAVRGRHLTSWPSLKTDLTNAGAIWEDKDVVVDQGLITSRKPADLPAFCREMVEEFAEGRHPQKGKFQGAQESATARNPMH